MYIPLETPTIVTAVLAAITPSPTSVPGHSTTATGAPAPPVVTASDDFDPFRWGPGPVVSIPWNLKVETPELPFIFKPDIPDQKYYHIGEAPVTDCIRVALKAAGRDRWHDLTSNGGWTDFLVNSRDHGLLGYDSNYDGNEMDGLLDWVKTMAFHDNPELDRETKDTKKCASLVRRFTTEKMLDEIILNWADDNGHFKNLPPTKPQPERRHVISDLILDDENHTKLQLLDGHIVYKPDESEISDGEEHLTVIRTGDGDIVFDPKAAHTRRSTTPPGNPPFNLTLDAKNELIRFLNALIDSIPHEKRTVRFNSTFPANSTSHNRLTVDGMEISPGKWKIRRVLVIPDLPPSHGKSTLLANSSALDNSTGHPDPLLYDRSTRGLNSTFLANSTSHGRPLVRRSFHPAALAEEIVEEVEEDLTEGVKAASLSDPEILEIFGKDANRLKSFFDQPLIHDLVYATTKKHHKHHKHGHHGKKEDSVWADPKFVAKFINDSIQGVKSSAEIVGGIVQVAEHKSHSKHKGDSKP